MLESAQCRCCYANTFQGFGHIGVFTTNPRKPSVEVKALCRRYLILHHEGGVYADSDVECLRHLSATLQPGDGLVAVWEDIQPSVERALRVRFGRQAQVGQLPACHA